MRGRAEFHAYTIQKSSKSQKDTILSRNIENDTARFVFL